VPTFPFDSAIDPSRLKTGSDLGSVYMNPFDSTDRWSISGRPEERAGRWEQMVATTHAPFALSIPSSGTTPYHGEIHQRQLGDLLLLTTRCDPCSGIYRGEPIKADAAEYVYLVSVCTGVEEVYVDRGPVRLAAGHTLIVSEKGPATRISIRSRLENRAIHVPMSALAEHGVRRHQLPELVHFTDVSASPLQRLLQGFALQLTDLDEPVPERDQFAVRNAATELLAAVLTENERAAAVSPTPHLRLSVLGYIEKNLADQALGPAAIAEALGVSVRTLHRAFDGAGETLGEAIRRRRLARARTQLSDESDAVTITGLATCWGFADASHFGRAFKQQYGMTPREYRVSVRAERSTSP
jgi:AraC family transcriptional activator of tynA and feaB